MLAVFDLDSTLFSIFSRNQAILRQLAENVDFRKRFPEESEVLAQVTTTETDWGIKTTLIRSGVRSSLEFFEAVREHWVQAFFSSHHLHLDVPYPGAVDFVSELHRAGAQIRYLTGRDIERMGSGTRASLQQWQFPLENLEHLYMKPDKAMDDHAFKVAWMKEACEKWPEIWFFENEPVIVNRVLAGSPKVNIVFMDSVHSGREEAPSHLPRLRLRYDFTRE